jgi:hypothetical protein
MNFYCHYRSRQGAEGNCNIGIGANILTSEFLEELKAWVADKLSVGKKVTADDILFTFFTLLPS